MPWPPTETAERRTETEPGGAPGLTFQVSIDPRGYGGAENMAIDRSLLAAASRTGRAFLRLYRFAPPCLSFGRHEPALARYDRERIARLGIDVVRRPTGGRAVWHEHDVTYAVAAPVAAFGTLANAYRAIHERLAAALRTLGAAAALAPSARGAAVAAGACFAAPVGGEVVVQGRKLVGSAQLRDGTAFLQHGSILLTGSQELIGRVSREPGPVSRETTLSAVLGRSVSFAEVADAVVRTWGDAVTPATGSNAPPRAASARFAHPAWTWRR